MLQRHSSAQSTVRVRPLLVLKKGSAEEPVLSYFDSMEAPTDHAKINAVAAEKLLKFLLQNENASLPPPSESQLQESDECGF